MYFRKVFVENSSLKARQFCVLLVMASLLGLLSSCSSMGRSSKSTSRRNVTKKSNSIKKVAKSSKSKPKRDTGQNAKVKIDGSAVYQVPNFDSPVLEYLDSGKEYKISQKLYPGIGGLGTFYKIRLSPGHYGYITDTDVMTSGGDNAQGEDADNEEVENDPLKLQSEIMNDSEPEDVGSRDSDSLLFTSFVGPSYNVFNYSEVLRNTTEQAATTLYGLKFSGPVKSLSGMPLDINLMFTTTAPSFYSKIATGTSGMMLIGDVLVSLPIYDKKRILAFYGFGLVMRYSKWSVTLKSNPTSPALESQEATLGVVGHFGSIFRITPQIAMSAQAKYYYEKEKYFGYGLSLLFKY